MTTRGTDVLVVGAGPTGLLLAIWLKKLNHNYNVRVVDKAAGTGTTSRATIVHARTLEFYRQLGLADDVLQEAAPVRQVQVQSNGRIRGRLDFQTVGEGVSRYPVVLSYPQERHEKLLLWHLKKLGVEVEWNKEVMQLEHLPNGARVGFLGGETVEAQFIAGCDGAHSAVRKQAKIEMRGSRYPAKFFVADVQLRERTTANDKLRICIQGKNFGLRFPLNNTGHTRLTGPVPRTAADATSWDEIRPSVESTINTGIDTTHWSSIYLVHHRVAETFRSNNVILLGDAAHVHSPVGGQGMNTGLGDATNLAWKLSDVLQGHASIDLLDSYHTERVAFAQLLVQTTDWILSLVIDEGWKGWLIRSVFLTWLVPLLWRTHVLPTLFFKRASQIGITYASGPLGIGEGKRENLNAGDRLPWIQFEDRDNFEPLESLKWQIHVYSSDLGSMDSARRVDLETYLFPLSKDAMAAGLKADRRYLIRPDGHIGAIIKASEGQEGVLRSLNRLRGVANCGGKAID